MATQFIANKQCLLSDVVNDIMPSTDRLSALVGYFYFSGFQELFRNLAGKEVLITVGIDIEKEIRGVPC